MFLKPPHELAYSLYKHLGGDASDFLVLQTTPEQSQRILQGILQGLTRGPLRNERLRDSMSTRCVTPSRKSNPSLTDRPKTYLESGRRGD